MSEVKYDSVLMGYVEDPRIGENGQIQSWGFSLNREQVADLSKYQTEKGNVSFTMFFSKAGKPMCRVYDPNSEAAKENRSKRATKPQLQSEEDPFND
jgi:hypothetical protein